MALLYCESFAIYNQQALFHGTSAAGNRSQVLNLPTRSGFRKVAA
jgi:hypothetical protein